MTSLCNIVFFFFFSAFKNGKNTPEHVQTTGLLSFFFFFRCNKLFQSGDDLALCHLAFFAGSVGFVSQFLVGFSREPVAND